MNYKPTYYNGIKEGLPIGLAYLAVSFSFGLVAVKDGLPVWLATLISATNLTSAGQFAGVNLIAASATAIEIFLAVLVINARYMLMSLSVAQQLDNKVGTLQRLAMSFFITDEIFAVASTKKDNLSFTYFMGLATLPYIGWTLGTYLGSSVNAVLPQSLQAATGIALYCMFIAIILPPAKKSKAIAFCIALSVALSCLMEFVTFLQVISFGFRVIICSVISAVVAALLFPLPNENISETSGGIDNGGSI